MQLLIHAQDQTPSDHHWLQNCSCFAGVKFICTSKICMTQSKLMILGSDYIARPGLLKPKHQISFVEVLIVKNCQCELQSSAAGMYWHYSRFVFGISPVITRELTTAVLIRFNFAGDNVMWSIVVHWTVTVILVSPVYIIATSQVCNHRLQTLLTWPQHQACWLCLHPKIRK